MTAAEGGGIFVSYRRQETSHLAGRLYDRLADRFGKSQVFIDVDAIEPGVDFAEEIFRAVAACKVLLAIIGPTWLTAADERGRRRLDDPNDIVRLEVEAALARGVRVIPILVEGAVMPTPQELPESLAGLARRNALRIRHESFRSDAGRLVGAIERIPGAPASAAVSSAPGPPVTDRWQPTVNGVSSELLQVQHNSMSHPGYMRRSSTDNPPSVRVGVRVACAQLDQVASTSELRAKFLRFLEQPAVMDMMREFTEIRQGAIWTARDDNPPFNFGAVFAPPGTEDAPVAWARVLLPDSLTRQYGRDPRCAYLVLYVEPRTSTGRPAPAASLVSWHQRLSGALKLPAAFGAFLADDLGLPATDDPPAEVGVWLKASRTLTELVEVDAFDVIAGTPQSNWFVVFALANPNGEQLSGVVLAWLRQMCDSSLHLDDYESALARLDSDVTSSRLVVRLLREEWDTWGSIVYIAALQVELSNTNDSQIRIASVSLSSEPGPQPPVDPLRPRVETVGVDEDELNSEVAAIVKDRYAPELASHRYVPPHGSVTGWVITTMPPPRDGGTPRLELNVREAVGTGYLMVIPRTDRQVSKP